MKSFTNGSEEQIEPEKEPPSNLGTRSLNTEEAPYSCRKYSFVFSFYDLWPSYILLIRKVDCDELFKSSS